MVGVRTGPDGAACLAPDVSVVDFDIQSENVCGGHPQFAPWNPDFGMIAAGESTDFTLYGGSVHAGCALVLRKSVRRAGSEKKPANRFPCVPIFRIGKRSGIEEEFDGIAFPGSIGFPRSAFRIVNGDVKMKPVRSGGGAEGKSRGASCFAVPDELSLKSGKEYGEIPVAVGKINDCFSRPCQFRIRETENRFPVDFQIRILRCIRKIRSDHGMDFFRCKVLNFQDQNFLFLVRNRKGGENPEGTFPGQFRLFQNRPEVFPAQENRIFGKGNVSGTLQRIQISRFRTAAPFRRCEAMLCPV